LPVAKSCGIQPRDCHHSPIAPDPPSELHAFFLIVWHRDNRLVPMSGPIRRDDASYGPP